MDDAYGHLAYVFVEAIKIAKAISEFITNIALHGLESPDWNKFSEGILCFNLNSFYEITALLKACPVSKIVTPWYKCFPVKCKKATHEFHEIAEMIIGHETISGIGEYGVRGKK